MKLKNSLFYSRLFRGFECITILIFTLLFSCGNLDYAENDPLRPNNINNLIPGKIFNSLRSELTGLASVTTVEDAKTVTNRMLQLSGLGWDTKAGTPGYAAYSCFSLNAFGQEFIATGLLDNETTPLGTLVSNVNTTMFPVFGKNVIPDENAFFDVLNEIVQGAYSSPDDSINSMLGALLAIRNKAIPNVAPSFSGTTNLDALQSFLLMTMVASAAAFQTDSLNAPVWNQTSNFTKKLIVKGGFTQRLIPVPSPALDSGSSFPSFGNPSGKGLSPTFLSFTGFIGKSIVDILPKAYTTIKLHNAAPNAIFTTVQDALGYTITLNGANSTDDHTAKDSLQYKWTIYTPTEIIRTDFSKIATKSFTFGAAGSYLVTLEVRDAEGFVTSSSHTVTVQEQQKNLPPVPSFTVSTTAGSLIITYDASATTDDHDTIYDLSYALTAQLSGGSGIEIIASSSNSPRGTYTFKVSGTYWVVLTVTDRNKSTASVGKYVTVTNELNQIRMISIPGDSFQMGDNSLGGDAIPVHQVKVSSFSMSSTEVSQSQYVQIMGVNPSMNRSDNNPVENVTWFDAVLFCNAQSKLMSLDTVYSYTALTGTAGDGCTNLSNLITNFTANGYRLPTEAEWEYACKAGSSTAYYWGTMIDNAYCWSTQNSQNTTHPIAKLEPNKFGLYDMSGNVQEWCNDSYEKYSSLKQVNPTGSQTAFSKIVRGGSYYSGPEFNKSSRRVYNDPNKRFGDYGFRIVKKAILENTPPKPSFTSIQAQDSLLVRFDASATTDDRDPLDSLSFFWTFTQGTSIKLMGPSNAHSVNFTFDSIGINTVMLTVTDKNGASAHFTREIEVTGTDLPPVPRFTTSQVADSMVIVFDASATTDDKDPLDSLSFYWTIYTGGSSKASIGPVKSPIARYTFGNPATYNVILSVTDRKGHSASTDQTPVTVNAVTIKGAPTTRIEVNSGGTWLNGLSGSYVFVTTSTTSINVYQKNVLKTSLRAGSVYVDKSDSNGNALYINNQNTSNMKLYHWSAQTVDDGEFIDSGSISGAFIQGSNYVWDKYDPVNKKSYLYVQSGPDRQIVDSSSGGFIQGYNVPPMQFMGTVFYWSSYAYSGNMLTYSVKTYDFDTHKTSILGSKTSSSSVLIQMDKDNILWGIPDGNTGYYTLTLQKGVGAEIPIALNVVSTFCIKGNYIAYQKNDTAALVYDLTSGLSKTVNSSLYAYSCSHGVDISGLNMVFASQQRIGTTAGATEIIYYNSETGKSQVLKGNGGFAQMPYISGNRVAWLETYPPSGPFKIFYME